VIVTGLQEVVEITDAGRLVETSSDGVVCLEETVDASGMPVGVSVDSTINPASSAEDDLTMKPASSLDTAQQTGTKQNARYSIA